MIMGFIAYPTTYTGALFALPEGANELFGCIGYFLLITGSIFLAEFAWNQMKTKRRTLSMRILFWELGAVLAIIIAYAEQAYCVVLPLMFLLVFLIMWFLTIIITREK